MRIAVFGPHPDDQELGMGGTIRALAERGHRILLVDVTDGEPTPFGDHDTRRAEAAAAMDILNDGLATIPGATPVRRMLLGERAFPAGGFRNRSVEPSIPARHAIASVIRAWQAEILFVTHAEDAHPDHRAVTRIVDDARFDAKLSGLDLAPPVDGWTGDPLASDAPDAGGALYPRRVLHYYATHLRHVPAPSLIIDIGAALPRKLDAIRAYHTQFVLPERNRRVVDWVAASAVFFGSRIGVDAGEPFFSREPIGVRDVSDLT